VAGVGCAGVVADAGLGAPNILDPKALVAGAAGVFDCVPAGVAAVLKRPLPVEGPGVADAAFVSGAFAPNRLGPVAGD